MRALQLFVYAAASVCYAGAGEESAQSLPFPFQSMRLRETPVAAHVKNLAAWKGEWREVARPNSPDSSRVHVVIGLHESGKHLTLRMSRSNGAEREVPLEVIAIPLVHNGDDLYLWVTSGSEASESNDSSKYATSGVIVKYSRDSNGRLRAFGHLRIYTAIVRTLAEENVACRVEGITLYVDDTSERFASAVARRSQDVFGDESMVLTRHTD